MGQMRPKSRRRYRRAETQPVYLNFDDDNDENDNEAADIFRRSSVDNGRPVVSKSGATVVSPIEEILSQHEEQQQQQMRMTETQVGEDGIEVKRTMTNEEQFTSLKRRATVAPQKRRPTRWK